MSTSMIAPGCCVQAAAYIVDLAATAESAGGGSDGMTLLCGLRPVLEAPTTVKLAHEWARVGDE